MKNLKTSQFNMEDILSTYRNYKNTKEYYSSIVNDNTKLCIINKAYSAYRESYTKIKDVYTSLFKNLDKPYKFNYYMDIVINDKHIRLKKILSETKFTDTNDNVYLFEDLTEWWYATILMYFRYDLLER